MESRFKYVKDHNTADTTTIHCQEGGGMDILNIIDKNTRKIADKIYQWVMVVVSMVLMVLVWWRR